MKGAVLGVRGLSPSAKGRKPQSLHRNWTGSSCHLRSSPLQRAAPFPGAARAWAAGGLGLGTAHKLPSAATAALLSVHF